MLPGRIINYQFYGPPPLGPAAVCSWLQLLASGVTERLLSQMQVPLVSAEGRRDVAMSCGHNGSISML